MNKVLAFADFVDARHAISLANGTVALELALRGLGIGPGDDVVGPGLGDRPSDAAFVGHAENDAGLALERSLAHGREALGAIPAESMAILSPATQPPCTRKIPCLEPQMDADEEGVELFIGSILSRFAK